MTEVLKGHISNVRYVWVSGGGCDACEELDGEEFYSADEIPDRPHPNCQCIIDVIEKGDEDGEGHGHSGNGSGNNDELCDCPEQAEALLEELDEIAGDAESLADEVEAEIDDVEELKSEVENTLAEIDETLTMLEEEVGQHKPDCENNVDKLYGEISAGRRQVTILERDIMGLLFPLATVAMSIDYFIKDVLELLAAENGSLDKYCHSIANCEAAQLGILGSLVAEALSDLRELTKIVENLFTQKKSIEKMKKDYGEHQEANRLGRERGRMHPNCDCRMLNEDVKDYHKKPDWKSW